jgi:signal transduction histidine kinase
MDPLRDVLARKRAEMEDRWDRQLRAAAEAGFPLDRATGHLLPRMLDSTADALERRFRLPAEGAAAPAAGARRAAIQASLLSDFIFDVAQEELPAMPAEEQRRLLDALAHAGVDVLVRHALELENERRWRDADRFVRLGHALRNSMTVAQLALDLLRRRGEMRETRAAAMLDDSLARLRAGLEDTLLDELLAAGGLRRARVQLDRMLADASGETAPEAELRGVSLLLETPPPLELSADPRVLLTAVRALLRVAVDLSRRGGTVRLQCARRREAARIAAVVDRCRRRPDGRLLTIGGLGLVRRAVRAHGGAVRVRGVPRDGCALTLDMPLDGD